MATLFGILLALTALFLILLVLVQRGRGGGLAGALGGAGGQSAFGTKAGDTFTKVTIVTAAFWILLCMASIKFIGTGGGSKFDEIGGGNAAGEFSTFGTGESETEDGADEGNGDDAASGTGAGSGEPPAGDGESGNTDE